MKNSPGIIFRSVLLVALLAAASACAPQAAPGPTQTPFIETVVVVQTAVLPASTATPTPTPPDATPTPTSVLAFTPSPSPTLTPDPSPTGIALTFKPIEGGDPNNKFYAMLVYPSYTPAATTSLMFRVYAHKPTNSKVDGEGIDNVRFLFVTSGGDDVYGHQENKAGYCAFQGGEPDCVIWVFADHAFKWPNGNKIVSDTYTLEITVTASDRSIMTGKTKFKIQLP